MSRCREHGYHAGAPVEIEKQSRERGTYQHPEFYGQPVEKGMNYDALRDTIVAHDENDPH